MVDNRKFNKILAVLLVIIVIAIVVSLGFVGYDFFQKFYINKGADDAINEFDSQLSNITTIDGNISEEQVADDNEITTENAIGNTEIGSTTNKKSTSTKKKNTIALKYKGYDVAGKIEIPKTKVKYPVLTVATLSSMKISVGIVYGPGLNKARKYSNYGT